ncbi:hypothetical protein ZTR_09729 [Talaromyces verruculosus]|nr:hypothetical protein ZTR_09729 [Talaromyces verruculosus]
MIVKPSPFTPCGGLKLVELGQRFFSSWRFAAVVGDDNLGPWLTNHPIPAKIAFIGSTVTGKWVMESASKTLKRVTLKLGGIDPAIVCEDVDIADVAPKFLLQIAQLAFLNTGQVSRTIRPMFLSGPIVPLSYSTYNETISKANDTHYGLGASVWSGSIERANDLAQKFQAGTVLVNTHFEFGGHKESGIGTVSGLVSYCNSQTLFLKK